MASILDEYEDSLSRSAVLQPGCPSVGIPHSGKGRESTAIPLGFPGTCTGRVGTVASKDLVHFMDVHYGSKSLDSPSLRLFWPSAGGWSKFERAARAAALSRPCQ